MGIFFEALDLGVGEWFVPGALAKKGAGPRTDGD
jgi:hypothetical protein